MDGNVMKMRAIPGLDLPAGKTVDLKPRRLSRDADEPGSNRSRTAGPSR